MNFIEVNLFYKRLEFIVYQIDNKLNKSVNSNFNIEKSSVKSELFLC